MPDFDEFETRAAAQAASIPSATKFVRTAGYAAKGDGGAALYTKMASAGSAANHPWQFPSADGAWWELSEHRPYIEHFGGLADQDITAALNKAFVYTDAKQLRVLYFKSARYNCNARPNTIINSLGLVLEGVGKTGTFIHKRYAETGAANGMLTFICSPLGCKRMTLFARRRLVRRVADQPAVVSAVLGGARRLPRTAHELR